MYNIMWMRSVLPTYYFQYNYGEGRKLSFLQNIFKGIPRLFFVIFIPCKILLNSIIHTSHRDKELLINIIGKF